MGGCQYYGPFLGTLNNRCRIIIETQKGTLILTTTHIFLQVSQTLGRSRHFRLGSAARAANYILWQQIWQNEAFLEVSVIASALTYYSV